MFNDLLMVAFRPSKFFTERYLQLDSKRIRILGFMGLVIGLGLGSLITYALSNLVAAEFSIHPDNYVGAIKSLGLDTAGFVELLAVQKAYALLLGFLAPVVGYMAPHIFGGAVFLFLWVLVRSENLKLEFFRVMDCVSIALCSMIFYAIPAVGPLVAVYMVGLNLSRALYVQHKIVGFMKTMGIVMAIYLCFFVSAASLQLLAPPLAKLLAF